MNRVRHEQINTCFFFVIVAVIIPQVMCTTLRRVHLTFLVQQKHCAIVLTSLTISKTERNLLISTYSRYKRIEKLGAYASVLSIFRK